MNNNLPDGDKGQKDLPGYRGVPKISNMVMIMWGLVLLLVASAGLAHVAGGLQSLGVIWAYHICATTGGLCEHPDWLAIGAGGIAAAYLLLRRVSV